MFELKIPSLTRLEKEIVAFESVPIETGKILFYGSSGFTRWKHSHIPIRDHRPLEEDIRMKDGSLACVNHGFGSSTIEEGLYYYRRAVLPWKPRAIVLRFFPNDLSFGYSPAEIVSLLARLCDWARVDFPGVKFYLCDAMPGVRYMNNQTWQAHAKQYNNLLKIYCDENEDCTYVSQLGWPGLYENPEDAGDYDKIRTDLFVPDGLHFNQDGYDVYRDLFLTVLDDIL